MTSATIFTLPRSSEPSQGAFSRCRWSRHAPTQVVASCRRCSLPRADGYVVCSTCLSKAAEEASWKVKPQGSTEATARAQRDAGPLARKALQDPSWIAPPRRISDIFEDLLGGLGVLVAVGLGAGLVALLCWGAYALYSGYQQDVDDVHCVTLGEGHQCVSPGEPGYDQLRD